MNYKLPQCTARRVFRATEKSQRTDLNLAIYQSTTLRQFHQTKNCQCLCTDQDFPITETQQEQKQKGAIMKLNKDWHK